MAWLMASVASAQRPTVDFEALPYAPRQMVCYRSGAITVDGRLDEPGWQAAEWSAPFVDIDGVRPVRHRTQVKLLWDDRALYIAARLDEPDLWATITTRDAVIFQDHDFEVFVDPGGDTHEYYELEVNALGTAFDLFLVKPYRDGGPALHAWDIAGLGVGVDLRGTLNRPGDRDDGWTVELAIPWAVLREASPSRRAPRDGEQWRLNFSRVQWTMDVVDGAYRKRLDLAEKDWFILETLHEEYVSGFDAIRQSDIEPLLDAEEAVRGEGGPATAAKVDEAYELRARALDSIRQLDAAKVFEVETVTAVEPAECRAGLVLQGRLRPTDCPAFGTRCNPETPLGATMVSAEGACAAYFHYGRVAAAAR